MKLDCITVTKILRCFRTNRCMKWRNIFKKEKFVVLAEYFKQQTDCSRYRKITNQGKVLRGGISRIDISISSKWKPCHGAINSWPRNLRTALEKYFRFQWNCKQTTGWSEEPHSKLWDLFHNYLWNYTYNFENIFTTWSYERLRLL